MSQCLSAGCGPVAHVTWPAAMTTWTLDYPMLAVLLVLAGGYCLGVREYRRAAGRWPISRAIAFSGGLLLFAAATMSFIGAFALASFWVRALQNVLLLMPVPLLLAAGAPVTLLAHGEGRRGAAARALIGSRPMRALTFPAVASLALLITPYALYFTGWYRLTLQNAFFDESLHLELAAIGFLYFWTRIRVDPVPRAFPHMISVWISFAEGIGDAGLALLLWLGHGLVAGAYYASLSDAPRSALYAPLAAGTQSGLAWNQAIGGAVFWLVGDLTSVPLLYALWRGLRREEQAVSELGETDLLPAEHQLPGAEHDPSLQLYQPWWITDPRLAARYGSDEPAT